MDPPPAAATADAAVATTTQQPEVEPDRLAPVSQSSASQPHRDPFRTINLPSAFSHLDVADPNIITNIIVEDRRDGTEAVKRVARFYIRALDLDNLESARQRVFGTAELLEKVMSYLPAKNVFGIRRVAKNWNGVVEGSVNLKRKLFLHVNREPREEVWKLEGRNRLGANDYPVPYRYLNNIQFNFRRVDVLPGEEDIAVAPVVLNPMLARHCSRLPNVVALMTEQPYGESVNFTGWIDPLRQDRSSLWKTYLSDPPCHRAEVTSITLCFGGSPPVEKRAEQRRWKPAKGGMAACDLSPLHPLNSHTIKVKVTFPGGVGVRSDAGLTMGDVLKAALGARGLVECFSYSDDRQKLATMHEVLDVMKERLGFPSLPVCPYMQLQMRLLSVGSTTLLVPSEEERTVVNAEWESLR